MPKHDLRNFEAQATYEQLDYLIPDTTYQLSLISGAQKFLPDVPRYFQAKEFDRLTFFLRCRYIDLLVEQNPHFKVLMEELANERFEEFAKSYVTELGSRATEKYTPLQHLVEFYFFDQEYCYKFNFSSEAKMDWSLDSKIKYFRDILILMDNQIFRPSDKKQLYDFLQINIDTYDLDHHLLSRLLVREVEEINPAVIENMILEIQEAAELLFKIELECDYFYLETNAANFCKMGLVGTYNRLQEFIPFFDSFYNEPHSLQQQNFMKVAQHFLMQSVSKILRAAFVSHPSYNVKEAGNLHQFIQNRYSIEFDILDQFNDVVWNENNWNLIHGIMQKFLHDRKQPSLREYIVSTASEYVIKFMKTFAGQRDLLAQIDLIQMHLANYIMMFSSEKLPRDAKVNLQPMSRIDLAQAQSDLICFVRFTDDTEQNRKVVNDSFKNQARSLHPGGNSKDEHAAEIIFKNVAKSYLILLKHLAYLKDYRLKTEMMLTQPGKIQLKAAAKFQFLGFNVS